ncbi:MAG: SIMPL domain-containing protein [Thiomicrorhabdus sp.]|nr:SIMPL domain-containing protein [Thiomicrorhabdus sp.]
MLYFTPPYIKYTKRIFTLLILWLTCVTTPVLASQISLPPSPTASESTLVGNNVYFSITESQEMDNDISIVTLSASAQARSAKSVMEAINKKMQAALATLKKYPEIDAQTTQYQVHPVYQKDRVIRHWNGSQSLVVTLDASSKQFQVLTELQEQLIYQNMQFKVSTEKRQEAMQQLTLKALHSFQQQAKHIANAFGSVDFKLLETRINTPFSRQYAQEKAFSSRMMVAESMAAPALEAGTSTLNITVSGVLLLPN